MLDITVMPLNWYLRKTWSVCSFRKQMAQFLMCKSSDMQTSLTYRRRHWHAFFVPEWTTALTWQMKTNTPLYSCKRRMMLFTGSSLAGVVSNSRLLSSLPLLSMVQTSISSWLYAKVQFSLKLHWLESPVLIMSDRENKEPKSDQHS